MSIDKVYNCANMKFRKEIIIFSLIIMIFMLMSAVSAEENITIGDGTNSTSDYIELESDQGYNEDNISENPILDDDVVDDENISEKDIEQDTCPGSLDAYCGSVGYEFNGLAHASASLNKNIAVHKSSSGSHFSKGDGADVRDNECNINGKLSNSKSLDAIGVEALNDIVHSEDIFAQICSSYGEYFDYLKSNSLENLIEENEIGDVFNSNIYIIDFATTNFSDSLIIPDNMALMNQTFDLNTMQNVCIDSYDIESDLHLSDDVDCWRDAQDSSDKTVVIQSFKFSQQVNSLSRDISEDIQHTFYHMIGCEYTNTSFTKQYNSYDNLPKVSEFDTIASAEHEDNHDGVLFKKYNVNSPFIVENTSIFTLFGVIEIKIP